MGIVIPTKQKKYGIYPEKKENTIDILKNKIYLYLDDDRTIEAPNNYELIIVRSFSAFINYIQIEGVPDVIDFDHDLSDEHLQDLFSEYNSGRDFKDIILHYQEYKEKTGYDAAKWLVEWCQTNEIPMPECFVHAFNPAGSQNILACLNSYSRVHENYECCKIKMKDEIKTTY